MKGKISLLILIILLLIGIAFSGLNKAEAQVMLDMNIIATIESSNNPLAYNARSGATGKFQITSVCLQDFNDYHKHKYKLKEMFEEDKCFKVSSWYMNVRIPSMLKCYKRQDTIKNRLWSYNAGIGLLVRGVMPRETEQYIKNYTERKNNGRKSVENRIS